MGSEVKKVLIDLGYEIKSVRKGKSSTGHSFVQGTTYPTLTIVGRCKKEKGVWSITDELIHSILTDMKVYRATSYRVKIEEDR